MNPRAGPCKPGVDMTEGFGGDHWGLIHATKLRLTSIPLRERKGKARIAASPCRLRLSAAVVIEVAIRHSAGLYRLLLTTVIVTCDGCCREWCTALCATIPLTSS